MNSDLLNHPHTVEVSETCTAVDLLTHLPRLAVHADGRVDFAATDIVILALLAQSAEATSKNLIRGMEVLGELLSLVGPQVDDGSINGRNVEVLGSLLADLGGMANMLAGLAVSCNWGIRSSCERSMLAN